LHGKGKGVGSGPNPGHVAQKQRASRGGPGESPGSTRRSSGVSNGGEASSWARRPCARAAMPCRAKCNV